MQVRFPDFVWAVGEEGSDPVVTKDGADLRIDEFAASGHYERMEADLADVAGLGIGVIRYGMPWRLSEPEPGVYDWSLWDRALAACEAAGLEPVVDLLHFGLPDHAGGLCEPEWIGPFLRYVEAFLARYREPRWFTPVNEPVTHALMAGRAGAWNDRRASDEDYARALAHVTLADLEAMARIRQDRGGWWIGADAVTCPVDRPADPSAAEPLERLLLLMRASFDLHLGHALDDSVEAAFAAVSDAVRTRISELALRDRIVAGHDVYPIGASRHAGRVEETSIADRVDAYARWAREWHQRYRVPFWVAETSNLGLPVSEGVAWLDAFAAALAALRAEGLPARGLCWYSRGDQFDWQTALLEPVGAVTEVGLFDRDRKPRPVAARFAELATAGPAPGTESRTR